MSGVSLSGMEGPEAPIVRDPRIEAQVALLRTLRFPVLLVVSIVVIWQLVIWVFAVPSFVAPSPLNVAKALWADAEMIARALGYTLRSTLLGMAVSLWLALSLAALFTVSDLLSRALLPLIVILRTAPILAIAPLLILIFGRGIGTSVAVVVMVTFFPIMVNAARGFRATPGNALELMHVAGATWAQSFNKVRLPFAIPYIFTGVRMAAAGAVLAAMLAEWLTGAPGLGTLILEASSFRNLPRMWAGVVVSMAAAGLFFAATVRIEQRLMR
ncbi:MAG: ABC transporter permease subunit [Rubellimicrobium sp.]|nr:ABC transporter permease subunit [Rubellimicrobium sp.]